MSDLSSFLTMGGYASYVWSAYFFVFIVILGNAFYIGQVQKRIVRQVQERIQNQDKANAD